MDVKYQIFVSSTYTDLIEERRHVIEAILNLGHMPVGMEIFQASNQSQWEHIKRRILECDYYVVIVGERYGSELGGKSYTQMEYEFAVANNIPVAAFLMDDGARKTLPRERVEFEKAAEIEAFRALCKQKLVAHWQTGLELKSQVILAITQLTRDHPMRGWVRPDKVTSDEVLRELAKLSEEKRQLQAFIDQLEAGQEILIPADALHRIRELETLPITDYLANESDGSAVITLLDVFLSSKKALAKGCRTWEIWEVWRDQLEIFCDDDEIAEEILSELSSRNLTDFDYMTTKSGQSKFYFLTEYGKDFIMYAEKWVKDSLPPTESLFEKAPS